MTEAMTLGTGHLNVGSEPDGWYLYAILDDEAALPDWWRAAAERAPGLVGVAAHGLRAAVAPPPAAFNALARVIEAMTAALHVEAPGDRPDAQPVPLEHAARSHEEIVELLSKCGPILPVRLGTVLRSLDDVEQLLVRCEKDLHEQLNAIGDRREWSLKVWMAATEAERMALVEAPQTASRIREEGPGHSYLAARRQGRLAADALQKVCDRIGQVVAAELAGAVEGFARTGAMGPIRAVGTGARDEPKREIQIVDGTYLVGPEEEAVFFSRLEDAMVPFPGLHADCSGPWPPYSFVRLRPEPVEETR